MNPILHLAITDCLELCTIYLISAGLLSKKTEPDKRHALLFFVYTVISVLLEESLLFPAASSIIGGFLFFVCLFLLLHISLTDTLIVFFTSTILMDGAEFLLIFSVPPFRTTSPTSFLPVIAMLFIVFFAFLFYKICGRLFLYQYIQKNIPLKIIIVNIYLISCSVIIYLKIDPKGFFNILLFLVLVFLLLFLLNWEIIANQKKLAQKEKELEIFRTYLPVVNELTEQVRLRQHQFDNQIQAISMLPATYKDYDSLADALTNYSGYVAATFRNTIFLKLNLKLLAGFLFSKCHEAENQKKELRVIIKNLNIKTILPEYKLVDALGILIDNAVENILEGDCATLALDSKSNKCLVRIKNAGPCLTEELRLSFFKKGYTTKTSDTGKHGMGLYHLKKLMDEYGGMIFLSNETDGIRTYVVFEFEV